MANPIRPEPGLIIRYDFLFESDRRRGQESGKERPVVVVITIPGRQEGDQNVIVAPITHTPPSSPQDGISLPIAVAHHLGLDDRPMWIKPRELNRFIWLDDRLPFGIAPIAPGEWSYGFLPPSLLAEVNDAVLAAIKAQRVRMSKRD